MMTMLVLIVQPVLANDVSILLADAPKKAVNTPSVCLLNLETDTMVYEKNSEQVQDPSALVKIMTTLLVLESVDAADLKQKITLDEDIMNDGKWNAAGAPKSELVAGEEVAIRDLIACVMVQSACDISDVLARYVGKNYLGGDETTFIAQMNERAKELGCTNTVFKNTHGLQAEGQVSTSADMMKITKYAVTLPHFIELSQSNYYEIEPTNKHENTIKLYGSNLMSSAISEHYYSKTKNIRIARTAEGKQHLATIVEGDEYTYALVQMGAPYADKEGNATGMVYDDAETLYKWALGTFITRTVVKKNDVSCGAEVKVALSAGKNYTIVVPREEIVLLLPRALDMTTLMRVPVLSQEVEAPIEEGEVLGKLQIQQDDFILYTMDLVAMESIQRNPAKFVWSRICTFFSSTPVKVIFMLLIGAAVMFVFYTIEHNRRLQRKRQAKQRRANKK